MNGLALIAAGVYVLLVTLRGNGETLVAQVQAEGGYVRWMGAVLVVYWLWKYKPFGDTISEIAGIGFAAVFFKMWPTIAQSLGVRHGAS